MKYSCLPNLFAVTYGSRLLNTTTNHVYWLLLAATCAWLKVSNNWPTIFYGWTEVRNCLCAQENVILIFISKVLKPWREYTPKWHSPDHINSLSQRYIYLISYIIQLAYKWLSKRQSSHSDSVFQLCPGDDVTVWCNALWNVRTKS